MRSLGFSHVAVIAGLLLSASSAQAVQIGYDMETLVGAPTGFSNVLNVDPTLDRGRVSNGATQSTGSDPVKFGSFSAKITDFGANLNNSFTNITPGAEFTIMAHIHLNAIGGDQVIASQWSGGWLFEVLNGNLNFQTTAGSQQVTAGIGANQWYHIAMTFDNGTLKFYVDGTQIGSDFDVSGTLGTSIAGNGGNMNIGNFAGGGGPLNGFMDDFYFDNAVLDSSQVTFYSTNAITTPIPEPASLMMMFLGTTLIFSQPHRKTRS